MKSFAMVLEGGPHDGKVLSLPGIRETMRVTLPVPNGEPGETATYAPSEQGRAARDDLGRLRMRYEP